MILAHGNIQTMDVADLLEACDLQEQLLLSLEEEGEGVRQETLNEERAVMGQIEERIEMLLYPKR